MRTVLFVIWGFVLSASVSGDTVVYEFTGVLPQGSSGHSQILDGESWTALFLVETTVEDSVSDPGFGFYESSIVSGSIEFSGGYSADLITVGNATSTLNDFDFGGGLFADGIDLLAGDEEGLFFHVGAHFETDSLPSSPLNDDSLPMEGVTFSSQGEFSEYPQLEFFDPNTGEIVFYTSLDAVNTTFSSYQVPEPSSVVFVAAFWLVGMKRRREG